MSNAHLAGQGCRECVYEKLSVSFEEFVNKAREAHGDAYDYSLVNWVNMETPVTIICNTCGDIFTQIPSHHVRGFGCRNCCGTKPHTQETFIEKVKEKHGDDAFLFDKLHYTSIRNEIILICNKCKKEFPTTPRRVLQGHGCPYCARRVSKNEEALNTYLQEYLNLETEQRKRKWHSDFSNHELDIYIPELMVAIEYNGDFWHGTANHPDPKNHQQQKMLRALEVGINVITIPEYIYTKNPERVKRWLKYTLKPQPLKSNKIISLTKKEANEFHYKYNILGKVKRAQESFALVTKDNEPEAVLSLYKINNTWYIARFTSKVDKEYSFELLFSVFRTIYKPEKVVFLVDARFETGCFVREAKFTLDKLTSPSYISLNNGNKIYDCGKWKWIWVDK